MVNQNIYLGVCSCMHGFLSCMPQCHPANSGIKGDDGGWVEFSWLSFKKSILLADS